ncbi:MAG: polyphosphate polymerase domain-containing protein [Chitinophagales bacterium]
MTYHTNLDIPSIDARKNQKQNLKNKIIATAKDFEAIALENLGQVKLLNRVDTKFTFGLEKLDVILKKLQKDYYILDIEANRVMDYESLYYDSSDLAFYLAHHNERTNRLKVRYRRYVVSDICFFELKFKNNKGRTIKTRIQTPKITNGIQAKEKQFLEQHHYGQNLNLKPALWVYYKRMTLVRKDFSERATIDIDLSYQFNNQTYKFNNVVIAELKQTTVNRNSSIFRALQEQHIHPKRLSKYCMGIISCYDNVKINRFKQKYTFLKKINRV